MCLAADVPLIESGTTGFNGQVQVIVKGKTACYDCNEKTTPKSFPVCTIRSTPSQPIHCIVWAKSYLLPELFGVSEDETPDLDTSENQDNAGEIENLRKEAQALLRIRESMGSDDFTERVFDKVFNEDIERLRKMEDMWKVRRPPEALGYNDLKLESATIGPSICRIDQRAWTKPESFIAFADSLQRLSTRLLTEQAEALKLNSPKPAITFDKDDPDTLDFVTAASNLRSVIFGIEPKSKFDIKQMAGNIIPAIATTNAMIAGLCVMQAFKVLKGEIGRTKLVFLSKGEIRSGSYEPPNPDCTVCGVAMSRVQIDPARATLADLVEDVLKLQLGYGEEITVLNSQGIVYDPDETENLGKKLEDLSIGDASFLTVQDDEDDGQDPRVDLQIAIEVRNDLPEDGKAVVLRAKPEIARRAKRKNLGLAETNGNVNGDGNKSGNVVETNGAIGPTTTAKRKRDADEAELDDAVVIKKAQAMKTISTPQETVVVDDAEEGAIEID
jgi:ubiquitin-like 1-activating enzyme E1 B